MENASEALITAGSVLIFIIALSITISSFTMLRGGVDSILSQTETVDMVQDSTTGEYVNYLKKTSATRIVGVDSVVPSMYRSLKENYVVYLKLKTNLTDAQLNDFQIVPTTAYMMSAIKDETNNIILNNDDIVYKFTAGTKPENNNNLNTILNKFYKHLIKNTSKAFYEYQGVYQRNVDSSDNTQTYRIITYIEK